MGRAAPEDRSTVSEPEADCRDLKTGGALAYNVQMVADLAQRLEAPIGHRVEMARGT
ncbi:MAG: hypothetical protein AMXMBFR82_23200 [Candidatus Hydrogenedentota bacterium]